MSQLLTELCPLASQFFLRTVKTSSSRLQVILGILFGFFPVQTAKSSDRLNFFLKTLIFFLGAFYRVFVLYLVFCLISLYPFGKTSPGRPLSSKFSQFFWLFHFLAYNQKSISDLFCPREA